MRKLIISLGFLFAAFAASAQTDKPDPEKKTEVLKAACGLCQFGMAAEDCALAVRYKGKVYWVEGTGIDDHGDAHADDGFCNKVRKASVQGEVVDKKFVVTYFQLQEKK